MSVPQELLELVERFNTNREAYCSGQYNETQLRREFIDPFFQLLGWDVNNKNGYAEAYKDVIHEDSIKIGGLTKAPDYCFRIGGVRKFFVETKRPSVNIKDDIDPAFQLRRYAWSAKLPLSILTDFEEFAVYDCRVKPNKTDKASTARIMYVGNWGEFTQHWDEIASIFSREAVLKGSFDRYAESSKAKKGTAEVDTAFLKEIESWRDALARGLALRNPELSQRDLNFAVQRTIDRIIFLRICEDRGIERYGKLMALQNGDRVYERLCELFYRADERYNSGLFHFQKEKDRSESPDTLTPNLAIDDGALKDVIKNLYYPDSPYEFSVLSADILGQVYEQFLGKVIRLTAGHRAVVEEKPEVRKAGGIYYTPTYIVDYIVKNTVGKLVRAENFQPQRKTIPKEISKIRILDPACGSGSFLLGAYQYLLDWHRDWYIANDPEKWATGRSPALYQSGRSEIQNLSSTQIGDRKSETDNWRLTTAERRRILLNNIYGVDIDPQAVEVTKLSLLLKVLEGESEQTIVKQLKMFHERALPDLGNNIKCGNSLIGTDFYNTPQTPLFRGEKMGSPLARGAGGVSDDERNRINPFDWDKEFPDIMKPAPAGREQGTGGFDAVIGNPPYIRIQTMKEWAPLEVEYYKQRYTAASKGNYDIYVVFVERGLSLLNKEGRLGFILPHKFFNAQYGEPLRAFIAKGRHLSHVVHFGDQQVFIGATTYTCLLFLDKVGNNQCQFAKVDDLSEWHSTGKVAEGIISAAVITASEWSFTVGKNAELFERLSKMPVKLGNVATRMYQGPITSADTVYLFKEFRTGKLKKVTNVFSKELSEWVEIESDILKPVIRSGSINRYRAEPTALVLFPYEVKDCTARLFSLHEMQNNYPLAWDYLNRNRKLLESRGKGKFRDTQWHRFGRTQNLGMWEQPKLMIPYMITNLAAYFDQSNNYYFINVTTGGYGIICDEKSCSLTYLCGLLNSHLLDLYFKKVSTNFHGGYFAANKQYIEQLPIRIINFFDPDDKARHDRMVAHVDQMLELHKQLASAKTDHDKTVIQRQIDATDRQIDQLVYELYGLTEEEIKIVEDNISQNQ